jgi:uncharacterized protein DUF29
MATKELSSLYERDETDWLRRSSHLIAEQRWRELDFKNLIDFLESMARREKRQVHSRLTQLLIHLLKWQFQARKRSVSWEKTIRSQRTALRALFKSAALRKSAEEWLEKAYHDAVRAAARETRLDLSRFPKICPYTMTFLLGEGLPESGNDGAKAS